jgi:hypothetical protein
LFWIVSGRLSNTSSFLRRITRLLSFSCTTSRFRYPRTLFLPSLLISRWLAAKAHSGVSSVWSQNCTMLYTSSSLFSSGVPVMTRA